MQGCAGGGNELTLTCSCTNRDVYHRGCTPTLYWWLRISIHSLACSALLFLGQPGSFSLACFLMLRPVCCLAILAAVLHQLHATRTFQHCTTGSLPPAEDLNEALVQPFQSFSHFFSDPLGVTCRQPKPETDLQILSLSNGAVLWVCFPHAVNIAGLQMFKLVTQDRRQRDLRTFFCKLAVAGSVDSLPGSHVGAARI